MMIRDMENYIDIYTLNDFHGAVFETRGQPGISRLGQFLISKKKQNPDRTIILSSGDMFQGTAISSLTKGDVMVEAMNIIGFDAMALGNHEFDWGLDELQRLCDGKLENMEADFPILAANILHKGTLMPAAWVQPYAVIEAAGLKIGVIGLIGEDLAGDILASVIKHYVFDKQMPTIKKYARILRDEGCDIVIVASHSDTSKINDDIARLPVSERVDAVINGHTHQYYAGEVYGDYNVPLPFIQSGSNGHFIGNIRLYIHKDTKEITAVTAVNLAANKYCTEESTEINNMLRKYDRYKVMEDEPLAVAGSDITRTAATIWAADALRHISNVHFGIINNGGIRASAFPIEKKETITYGRVFQMMPFDNIVVRVRLTGAYIKNILKHAKKGKITFSSNVNINTGQINNKKIAKNKTYMAATVDFVYESAFYLMDYEDEGVYTTTLYRDVLVRAIKTSAVEGKEWNL